MEGQGRNPYVRDRHPPGRRETHRPPFHLPAHLVRVTGDIMTRILATLLIAIIAFSGNGAGPAITARGSNLITIINA